MHNLNTTLNTLTDFGRPYQVVQRRGRGNGSKRGAMCGRGGKGDSCRPGWRKRYGYEGGQVPLHKKSPIRGFSRGRFLSAWAPISFAKIDQYFDNGQVVSVETLYEIGLLPKQFDGRIKIVNVGKLTKKVSFEAHGFTKAAAEVIEKLGLKKEIVAKKVQVANKMSVKKPKL